MLALVAIAAVFVVLGVLYLLGMFNLFASQTGVHHVKHAVVLGALAVACLVGASFLRPRTA